MNSISEAGSHISSTSDAISSAHHQHCRNEVIKLSILKLAELQQGEDGCGGRSIWRAVMVHRTLEVNIRERNREMFELHMSPFHIILNRKQQEIQQKRMLEWDQKAAKLATSTAPSIEANTKQNRVARLPQRPNTLHPGNGVKLSVPQLQRNPGQPTSTTCNSSNSEATISSATAFPFSPGKIEKKLSMPATSTAAKCVLSMVQHARQGTNMFGIFNDKRDLKKPLKPDELQCEESSSSIFVVGDSMKTKSSLVELSEPHTIQQPVLKKTHSSDLEDHYRYKDEKVLERSDNRITEAEKNSPGTETDSDSDDMDFDSLTIDSISSLDINFDDVTRTTSFDDDFYDEELHSSDSSVSQKACDVATDWGGCQNGSNTTQLGTIESTPARQVILV